MRNYIFYIILICIIIYILFKTKNYEKYDSETFGFFILRHVNSEITNKYWIECYTCIRKFYPNNKIVIIDDNSNYNYITNIELYNTEIINSEFHGRGELLPYYYYLQNKYFDYAVILHDSVFIQKYINFKNNISFLWEFEHDWDVSNIEIELIKKLDNYQFLLEYYNNKHLWKGCFGIMSVINFNFIKKLNDKYNFIKLLDYVKNRNDRMRCERVIACMISFENKDTISLFGNIHQYMKWGTTYDEYKSNNWDLPLVKIWTGR